MSDMHELIAEAHRIIRNHNKSSNKAYDAWLAKAGMFMRQTAVQAPAEDIDFTPLMFGKHRGKTPRQIYDIDPGYLAWMHKAIKPARVSERLAQLAESVAKPRRVRQPTPVTAGDDF
jgi:uncharacterized protein (DUF3820 family)